MKRQNKISKNFVKLGYQKQKNERKGERKNRKRQEFKIKRK